MSKDTERLTYLGPHQAVVVPGEPAPVPRGDDLLIDLTTDEGAALAADLLTRDDEWARHTTQKAKDAKKAAAALLPPPDPAPDPEPSDVPTTDQES